MKKLTANTLLKPFKLVDIRGNKINIPEPGRWTHIQFRRYSGCVMCNLHVQELISRQTEINAAGIQEVIFFQSQPQYLQTQFADKPVILVADPAGIYYGEFGVESSLMSIANPAAWIPGLKGMLKFGVKLPHSDESPLGLPADFLIDDEGIIVAAHYGKHAYDQWSVDQLLALVEHQGVAA
jgi:peroxiredoxin